MESLKTVTLTKKSNVYCLQGSRINKISLGWWLRMWALESENPCWNLAPLFTNWKRWEYQTAWSTSWETCMQVRKQQLELDMEGKGVHQGCILSPCLFNFYAEYIMWNAGLDEAQAQIKIAGRNISYLRYADDTTLMAKSKEELRASWWKWKRRVKKLA